MRKEVKIFGKNLTLSIRNDGDHAIANELFLDHQYKYCDEIIKKATKAVIDIGGHLGFFSLYASVLNSVVPIYTYEPHTGNFAILKENLKQNRIKNVFPKNLAVAGHEGEVELHISREDLNHSIVHAIEDTDERQKVGAITLEKIINRHDLGQVDLLKIDAEGAEFQILIDTPKEVLAKVSNIFLEYHDWMPENNHNTLKTLLISLGFIVEDYPNYKMPKLGFLWCRRK